MTEPDDALRELQEREAEEVAFLEAQKNARAIQWLFNILGGEIEGTIHGPR